MSAPYPLNALRALALHVQGLDLPTGSEPAPTLEQIAALVERLGCVQIDTLHMVRRAQYVTLWSRLGAYDPADFDRLIYDPQVRQLFEYWGHAASIMPLKEYRFRMPAMQALHDSPSRWFSRWLAQPGSAEIVEAVRARIAAEGALRTADFEHDGKRGSWWDWKPAKRALEYLFDTGELMVTDRVNFQRVYDRAERVLPEWVDAQPARKDEALSRLVEQAFRALGVCEPIQAAEYAYIKRGTARPVVEKLVKKGLVILVQGETLAGERELAVHRDLLPLLDRAAAGDLPARRTTFLNPFDSLFWARGRDEAFWGFRQVLEAYKPEKDRIWGYYCLPILHGDRLVGRFDPRLDRKSGELVLRALYLEPEVRLDAALLAAVADAMRGFLGWHGASTLQIERSDPPEFAKKLLAAL